MPSIVAQRTQIPVGHSIPVELPHAISVSLPTWNDVVAYEEAEPWIVDLMQTGYPRFFIHRSIQRLATLCLKKFAQPSELCILLPTPKTARSCRSYLQAHTSPPIPTRIVEFIICPEDASAAPSSGPNADDERCGVVQIVLFPKTSWALAKSFWQHTGDGISSRRAEKCLHLLGENVLGAEGSTGEDGSKHEKEAEELRELASSVSASLSVSNGSGLSAPPPLSTTSASDSPTSRSSSASNRASYSKNSHYARNSHYSRTATAPSNTLSKPSNTTTSSSTPSSSQPIPKPSEDTDADHALYVEQRYGRNLPIAAAAVAKTALRRRIAGVLVDDADELEGLSRKGRVEEKDVWLYPTGMSAIFHAHQACLGARAGKERKSVCYGFPYADTLKVLQKWGPGCHFFGQGSTADLASLTDLLSSSRTPDDPHPLLALFCEYPTNPLLRSPDLVAIRKLADEYGFFVVVDETIGNFVNVEVLEWADIVVSSLSKVFSGEVNVMGGSLVLNPSGPYYPLLRDTLSSQYEDNYCPEDAIFMERNSRDFMPRIETINSNAEHLVDLLHSHSTLAPSSKPLTPGKPIVIKEVYYPKYSTPKNYLQCRRPPFLSLSALSAPANNVTSSTSSSSSLSSSSHTARKSVSTAADDANGRFGGLFSLTFTSDASSRAFFDTLACAKGPSLGTNFTLACPYTLLAHYQELDWAGDCGVNKNLVRVSVGLEDEETLERWFMDALKRAEDAYVEGQ